MLDVSDPFDITYFLIENGTLIIQRYKTMCHSGVVYHSQVYEYHTAEEALQFKRFLESMGADVFKKENKELIEMSLLL